MVIPCYRYGRFLGDCVASVLSQTGVAPRCLIIDDCSNDGSAEIARDIARNDARVEVIVHAVNRGHIATYNEGIDWIGSDYFLLLSADDMVTPGAFARAIAVMEANPRVVLAHGYELTFHTGDPLPVASQADLNRPWHIETGEEFLSELCRSARNFVGTSTAIVRTRAQKAVGGYRKDLPHAGDLEMWMRLSTHGDVAATTGFQGVRRLHTTNMSAVQFGSAIADFRQVRAAIDSFFANEGRALAGAQQMASAARERLAQRYFWLGLDMLRRTGSRQGVALAGAALRSSPVALLGILDMIAGYIEPELQSTP